MLFTCLNRKLCYADVLIAIYFGCIILTSIIWIWANRLLDNKCDDFFLAVISTILTHLFEWRSERRKIKLIFHVSYFMVWEFFIGVITYGLWKSFRELEGKQSILRGLSDTIAMITCLFTSFQCSWLHIKLIRCALNGVSKFINWLDAETCLWNL